MGCFAFHAACIWMASNTSSLQFDHWLTPIDIGMTSSSNLVHLTLYRGLSRCDSRHCSALKKAILDSLDWLRLTFFHCCGQNAKRKSLFELGISGLSCAIARNNSLPATVEHMMQYYIST